MQEEDHLDQLEEEEEVDMVLIQQIECLEE